MRLVASSSVRVHTDRSPIAAGKIQTKTRKDSTLPLFSAEDGADIYYKDWGMGDPIVFSHGWPLNADTWDAQMLFFGQQGISCDRARPPESWALQPDVGPEQLRYLGRRPIRVDRATRPDERHSDRALYGRR